MCLCVGGGGGGTWIQKFCPATLTTILVGEGAERIQIPLKAGHHQSTCQRDAICWRADNGPTLIVGLGTFVSFQGIRTSIAKKPYSFVIFHGGGGVQSPSPTPL